MAESMSPREMHEQAVQQIESDYLSVIASAKKNREASIKQATDAEKQTILQAKEVIAQGKRRLEESKDRIERSIRQHELRETVKAQEKAVIDAGIARAKAISLAAEAEKKAINAAKESHKEAMSQAKIAQKQAGKEQKAKTRAQQKEKHRPKAPVVLEEAVDTGLNKVEDSQTQKPEAVEISRVKDTPKTEPVKTEPVPVLNTAGEPLTGITYHGRVTLSFSGGVNAEQLMALENSLRQWPDTKLLMVSGSSKDIQMIVSVPAPIPLSDKLKTLPVVEDTLPADGHIQIKFRSLAAKQ